MSNYYAPIGDFKCDVISTYDFLFVRRKALLFMFMWLFILSSCIDKGEDDGYDKDDTSYVEDETIDEIEDKTCTVLIRKEGVIEKCTLVFSLTIEDIIAASKSEEYSMSDECLDIISGEDFKNQTIKIDSVGVEFRYTCELPIDCQLKSPYPLNRIKNYKLIFPNSCNNTIEISDDLIGTGTLDLLSNNTCDSENYVPYPWTLMYYYEANKAFWDDCETAENLPFYISDRIKDTEGSIRNVLLGDWEYRIIHHLALPVVYPHKYEAHLLYDFIDPVTKEKRFVTRCESCESTNCCGIDSEYIRLVLRISFEV